MTEEEKIELYKEILIHKEFDKLREKKFLHDNPSIKEDILRIVIKHLNGNNRED